MNVEQLVAAVARETGVKLSAADPVLAAATINEILLENALSKLDRQMTAQVDRVTAASTQAVLDSKKEAEALLAEAGVLIEARIKAAGEAAAASVLTHLRQEAQKAEQAKRVTVRLAWVTAFIAMVVLFGVGGMALAGLK